MTYKGGSFFSLFKLSRQLSNAAIHLLCCVLQVVGIETEKVSKEKAVADEEEQKVAAIAVVVSGKQRDCEEDLAKAEPALLAAQDALNTLNKVSRSRDISLRLIDLLRHRLPRLFSLFKCSFSLFDFVFFFSLPFPSLFPSFSGIN